MLNAEFTLSSHALLTLLKAGPVGPQARLEHWQAAEALAYAVVNRVSALQALKQFASAEEQAQLDRQVAEVFAGLVDPDRIPPRPPRWVGPWPPPNWSLTPKDLAVIAASFMRSAALQPEVEQYGLELMHEAVRQLNTGH